MEGGRGVAKTQKDEGNEQLTRGWHDDGGWRPCDVWRVCGDDMYLPT